MASDRDIMEMVEDLLNHFEMEQGYPHSGVYSPGERGYEYVTGPVSDELGMLLEEIQEWYDMEQGVDRDIEFVSFEDYERDEDDDYE